MRIAIYFLFCLWSLPGVAQTSGYQKLWETRADFKQPYAVAYDKKNNVYYVANKNKSVLDDGYDYSKRNDGFISKVSPKGEIIALKWIEGLTDPADLFVKDNQLFVADDEFLVIVDIAQGKIIKQVSAEGLVNTEEASMAIFSLEGNTDSTETMQPPPPPPEGTFLSSVTGSPDGNIFIRDHGHKSIYVWKDNKLSLLVRDEERLDDDSNIIWDEPTSKLWALSFDHISAISPKDKSISTLPADAAAPAMGIVRTQDAYLIVSSFNVVFQLKAGKLSELFPAGEKCGCKTDIEVANGEIVVLNSNLNKLISYKRR
jgi:hypothetical protein